MSRMNWDQAATTVGSIVQEWTLEDGPGGAILLFDDRDIRAEAAGGLADIAHDLPFRTDTALRYASVSKHFLASLLLSGTPIHLGDTLGQHLILPDAAAGVTVGRALDMTGGLPDMVETLALLGIPSSTAMSRHRLMDAAGLLLGRLNFTPGHEISYSNSGYRLVQAALMAKGLDYPALLRERLFRPLGLSIRLPEDETEPVPGLATGYIRTAGAWRSGRYGMHISASGGLAGNAIDLATWGQALIGDHAPAGGLLARLAAPRHLVDGRATQYGLGIARSEIGGHTMFGHGGSLPGYR
jgi:CubicO group peptidase (beta-lactamase class C family)